MILDFCFVERIKDPLEDKTENIIIKTAAIKAGDSFLDIFTAEISENNNGIDPKVSLTSYSSWDENVNNKAKTFAVNLARENPYFKE